MATRQTEIAAGRSARPAPEGREDRVAAPAGGSWPRLDPDLTAELAAGGWDHPWELAPDIHASARRPSARHEDWTLERMLAPFARDAFAVGTARTVLDLRCGEGWLAQRMLARGARRVVGLDDRPDHLRRARLLRRHFALTESALELRASEGPTPTPGETFDLVLLVGAAEREPPGEDLLRAVREMTGHACAIECRGRETAAAPRYVLGERELLIAISGARR